MILQCPACKSENVKKLSLIYQEGTVTSNGTNSSSSVGIGVGTGGLGVGIAKTQGVTSGINRSLLSSKHAPPPKGSEPKIKQKYTKVTPKHENGRKMTIREVSFVVFMVIGTIALILSPIMWFIGLFGIGPGFLRPFSGAIFFFILSGILFVIDYYILPQPPKFTENEIKEMSERNEKWKKEAKQKEYELNKDYRIALQEHAKAYAAYLENDPYQKWSRSFLCLVCEHKFEPKNTNQTTAN